MLQFLEARRGGRIPAPCNARGIGAGNVRDPSRVGTCLDHGSPGAGTRG